MCSLPTLASFFRRSRQRCGGVATGAGWGAVCAIRHRRAAAHRLSRGCRPRRRRRQGPHHGRLRLSQNGRGARARKPHDRLGTSRLLAVDAGRAARRGAGAADRRRQRRPARRPRRRVPGTRRGSGLPARRRAVVHAGGDLEGAARQLGRHRACRWPISTPTGTSTSCWPTATPSTTASSSPITSCSGSSGRRRGWGPTRLPASTRQ